MKVIKPSFEIMSPFDREAAVNMLKLIELAGRTCYKSEGAINAESCSPFVERIAKVYKHESVLEHAAVTVRFVVDRGISHELVRHRIASFSQESTRYVNYSKGVFGSEITVIEPPFWGSIPEGWDTKSGVWPSMRYKAWYTACLHAEHTYMSLLADGATAQQARSVLPNSLKTEVVMTCNLREWMHVFRMRAHSDKAHPQMREVMIPLANRFHAVMPELFDAVEVAPA